MNAPVLKANKPLAPFIVFFALVILLTIAIANMRAPEEPLKQQAKPKDARIISLSPMKDIVLEKPFKTVKPIQVAGPEQNATVDAKKLLAEAFKCLDEGNVQAAEDKFRTVLVFEPDNIKALSAIGGLLYKQGKYPDAELFFRNQAKLSPDDATVYNNLGAVLAKQRKYSEAIKSMERGLLINPDSGVALFNLSGMNSLAGNAREAIDNFKKAYVKLGEKILPLSNDPSFDNIRSTQEFKDIIDQASSASNPYGDYVPPSRDEFEPYPPGRMDEEPRP